ncbi:LysR family transcriptional regulator [Cryobacterium melibiosiphilum]|nr:LysR family transcriptional regulator [Cryobacterium melibiosiphilum]
MLAALDRLGTIAAVAVELHLTAPGVSMQLATLERDVGLTLTERHGRTLALTPAGRLLARHGRDLVDRLSLAEMEVAALRGGTAGTYRVAAFPSIARTIVADTWRTLLERPELGLSMELLELEPQDALPALAAGSVELALTHAYSNMPQTAFTGYVAVPLATEPVWLAVRADDPAAPTPAGTGPVPADLRDFARHPWIIPHRSWACHEMVQRACGLAGFAPRAVAEATDFAVSLALVAAGVGVALVPHFAVARVPAGVTLHPLRMPIVRHDYLVTRESTYADPGIQRLQALFAQSVARIAPDCSPVIGNNQAGVGAVAQSADRDPHRGPAAPPTTSMP